MAFTLRYPISVMPPNTIGGIAGFSFEGLTMSLKMEDGYHTFYFSGFQTAEDAVNFAGRLWLALAILVTDRHTAFTVFEGRPRIEPIHDDPEKVGEQMMLHRPVDVIVDSVVPSVYPSDARLARVAGGQITPRIDLPFEVFRETFSRVLSQTSGLSLSAKLELALNTFISHYYEASNSTKVVILVTCLEILAEAVEKHPVALGLIDRWNTEVEELLETELEEDALDSLKALQREMLFRREDSL